MARKRYRYLDPLIDDTKLREHAANLETFPTPTQKASQLMFDQIVHDIREESRQQAAADAAQAIRTAHNQAVERYARWLEREHQRQHPNARFTLKEAAAMLRQLADSPDEEEL